MKKFITVVTALMVTVAVNAQVRIGVKGAYNYAAAKAVYSAVKQSTAGTHGYGIGVIAKVPFDGVLHFAPSVMINKRGFIVNNPANNTNQKEQYGITYLDLIPAFSAEFEKGDNAFSITAGPVLGFTNFGKLKITNSTGVTGSQNLKFGFGAYGWADLGLQAGIGYRFNKIAVDATYYLGLANINNLEETDGRNIQNRVASFGLIYYFKQAGQ